ncbi:MAG TPA: amidohydrolase [Anaerolineales bacterium]|nr:amidohydrolase [Anaerolineales bacterium]
MNKIAKQAQELFPYTQMLRRDFHMHPELGFQEVRTAGIVANELRDLGLEVHTGIAETGVVALVKGQHPGPVLLVRFDMDALPVQEETGAEYASQTPGIMHACGHDGHTAIGLTVARILNAHRNQIHGTVKLVFQPAEEGIGGAKRMVEEGVLENPRPDSTLALHLWNVKPLGWLGITPGPLMAASETFSITITGKGGHGASPHKTADPLYAAAQIVTALQSIVSRNVPPLETAVVSVTSIHSGTTFNVIPQTAELQGTIRTFNPEIRKKVLSRFREIATGVADALNCTAEVQTEDITPAVINDPEITHRVQQVAQQLFPDAKIDTDARTMGSEDMAFMMEDIPGCYFFIGSANSARGLDAAHHHPRFDFDESALTTGAALMSAVVLDLLK